MTDGRDDGRDRKTYSRKLKSTINCFSSSRLRRSHCLEDKTTVNDFHNEVYYLKREQTCYLWERKWKIKKKNEKRKKEKHHQNFRTLLPMCRYYVPCSRALIHPPRGVMSPCGTKPEAAKLALAKTQRLPVPLPAPPVSLAEGQKLM